MMIPLWQGIVGFVTMLTGTATVDVFIQERRRRRFNREYQSHAAKMRRYGMEKLQEIPAPDSKLKGQIQ